MKKHGYWRQIERDHYRSRNDKVEVKKQVCTDEFCWLVTIDGNTTSYDTLRLAKHTAIRIVREAA